MPQEKCINNDNVEEKIQQKWVGERVWSWKEQIIYLVFENFWYLYKSENLSVRPTSNSWGHKKAGFDKPLD